MVRTTKHSRTFSSSLTQLSTLHMDCKQAGKWKGHWGCQVWNMCVSAPRITYAWISVCTDSSPPSSVLGGSHFLFLPKCLSSNNIFNLSALVLIPSRARWLHGSVSSSKCFLGCPKDAKICPHNSGQKEISTTLRLQPHFPLLVSSHWTSSGNWSPILGVPSFTRYQDKQGVEGTEVRCRRIYPLPRNT